MDETSNLKDEFNRGFRAGYEKCLADMMIAASNLRSKFDQVALTNQNIDGKPLGDLKLTVRTHRSLMREGIHTVGELTSLSESGFLAIRNCGLKTLDEVKTVLATHGMHLCSY